MAQKLSVQYIRYYTDGSAARKLTPVAPVRQPQALPKQRKLKKKAIYIDPLPTLGIILAVCMLLMMAVGLVRLQTARAEVAAMENYVEQLTQKNEKLSAKYAEGYTLENVRQTALALDMVPVEQVQTITIQIPVETEAPETITLWEQIGTFLSGLFA